MSSNKAIARFHVLLSKLGMKDQKETILDSSGVQSTKDLTIDQLNAINNGLQKMLDSKTTADPAIKKARSAVISALEDMGIYKGKDSWPQVNKFLQQPRIAGKLLYQCSLEELKALPRKLAAIKAKWDKQIEDERYRAANN